MLEVFLGEGAAGLGLEILFEGNGLGLVSECHSRFNPPREELRRVRHFAAIVGFEAFLKVLSHPHVPVAGRRDAPERVDVPEVAIHGIPFPWLAERQFAEALTP